MRKRYGLYLLLLLVPTLLSGSGFRALEAASAPGLVTQVDVVCRREYSTLTRHYTQPRKIEPILNYLRLLTYHGRPDTDPERMAGNAYEITLHYASGRKSIYRQRAEQFLSKDGEPWERIRPEQASLLFPLLQNTPSD